MASNTPDILLLFGIEGGGDITSGSGKLISDSLEEIVRKVETNIGFDFFSFFRLQTK